MSGHHGVAPKARPRPNWFSLWAKLVVSAAMALTVIDAALLERKFGYFRGGFLAEHTLRRADDLALLLLASLASDVVIVGLLAGCVLYLAARTRIRRAAAVCLAAGVAMSPTIVDNVITYQLVAYLGDEMNLPVLIALTRGAPTELLAVSAWHLLVPAAGVMGGIAFVAAVVWGAQRLGPAVPLPTRPPARQAGVVFGVLALAGVGLVSSLRLTSDIIDSAVGRKSSGRVLGELVAFVTDFDRDGFGLLDRPRDAAMFDAAIRPYAVETPGNGIDEDGVGGDLPVGDDYREDGSRPAAWKSRPDVVFILLESVRADAIGARVDGRAVTPVIDALAARGLSVPRAYSHNGFTYQSRHHLLAGSLGNIRGDTTLLDDFTANGYEVAYFSGQDETFGGPELAIRPSSAGVFFHAPDALDRRYTEFTTPGSVALPFDVIEEKVGEFLDRRASTKPLFLYVNFHDTHFPYSHAGIKPLVSSESLPQAQISADTRDRLRSTYFNTVANVDAAIGRILEHARERLRAEPAVIVTSDHGESLFEEGFLGHGYSLNDAQTHVPFVVTGLPLIVPNPMGQTDLRAAVWNALGSDGVSALASCPSEAHHRVFQYIGLLDEPIEIGFLTPTGQVVYHFRNNHVRFGNGPWRAPDSLDAGASNEYLALVHFWERLVRARSLQSHAR